jgi:hypothetical protein
LPVLLQPGACAPADAVTTIAALRAAGISGGKRNMPVIGGGSRGGRREKQYWGRQEISEHWLNMGVKSNKNGAGRLLNGRHISGEVESEAAAFRKSACPHRNG